MKRKRTNSESALTKARVDAVLHDLAQHKQIILNAPNYRRYRADGFPKGLLDQILEDLEAQGVVRFVVYEGLLLARLVNRLDHSARSGVGANRAQRS